MEAFIATLERFVARRGLPHTIYSDNGTNFVGTSRHLRQVSEFLTEHHFQLFDYFTLPSITWHFNPPQAPNFGGLWEAAVKSAKSLFNRLLTSSAYTFEEYCTIFSCIEAILNSRPLCRTLTDLGIHQDISLLEACLSLSQIRPPYRNTPAVLDGNTSVISSLLETLV